jgi:hypothetical protein
MMRSQEKSVPLSRFISTKPASLAQMTRTGIQTGFMTLRALRVSVWYFNALRFALRRIF